MIIDLLRQTCAGRRNFGVASGFHDGHSRLKGRSMAQHLRHVERARALKFDASIRPMPKLKRKSLRSYFTASASTSKARPDAGRVKSA